MRVLYFPTIFQLRFPKPQCKWPILLGTLGDFPGKRFFGSRLFGQKILPNAPVEYQEAHQDLYLDFLSPMLGPSEQRRKARLRALIILSTTLTKSPNFKLRSSKRQWISSVFSDTLLHQVWKKSMARVQRRPKFDAKFAYTTLLDASVKARHEQKLNRAQNFDSVLWNHY